MKITSYVCDVCKKPSKHKVSLFSEYEKDICSGRTEHIYEEVDLCDTHIQNLLGALLHNVPLDKQREAGKILRSGKSLTGADFK